MKPGIDYIGVSVGALLDVETYKKYLAREDVNVIQ